MSIGTSINGRATSSRDGTRSKGAERRGSPAMSSTENWASSVSNACPDHARRGPNVNVKPVGERSAGNPHAAFDERGKETEPWCGLRHRHLAKAAGQQQPPHLPPPRLSSTLPKRRHTRATRHPNCRRRPVRSSRLQGRRLLRPLSKASHQGKSSN